MTHAALRNHYVTNAVETVSPSKLVTMLYDAMMRDLALAEQALEIRDLSVVNERLCHAQEIICELQLSLDASVWDGAKALASLYDYVLDRLVAANVKKDPALMAKCRDLLEPLQTAWHEIAGGSTSAK